MISYWLKNNPSDAFTSMEKGYCKGFQDPLIPSFSGEVTKCKGEIIAKFKNA